MVIDVTDVVVEDGDPSLILVGFDSEDPSPGPDLMLRRWHKFDEQDIAPGLDSVSIERDSQEYSAYGGIPRFEPRRDRAGIRLDAATARKLGNEAEDAVRFDLEDRRFEE